MALWVPESKFLDNFLIQTSHLTNQNRTSKKRLGHFINLYFYVVSPLARAFQVFITEGVLESKSCQHKLDLELIFLSNSNCAGLLSRTFTFHGALDCLFKRPSI